MPCDRSVLGPSTVVLRHHGAYTFHDVMASIETAAALAAEMPVSLIFDVRESTSPRSLDEFRRMASAIRRHPRLGSTHAVVQHMDRLLYVGMTRQLQAVAESEGIGVVVGDTVASVVTMLGKSPGVAPAPAAVRERD